MFIFGVGCQYLQFLSCLIFLKDALTTCFCFLVSLLVMVSFWRAVYTTLRSQLCLFCIAFFFVLLFCRMLISYPVYFFVLIRADGRGPHPGSSSPERVRSDRTDGSEGDRHGCDHRRAHTEDSAA